jgi:phosphopentomutase
MQRPFDQIGVVILDGVGCGESDDCKDRYPGDCDANSLVHASKHNLLDAPGLQSMGLEYIRDMEDVRVRFPTPHNEVRGAYGALEPNFPGKGSPEGHQALMGWEPQQAYEVYDETPFPDQLMDDVRDEVTHIIGREVEIIRNKGTDDISGTTFIHLPNIGPEHLQSRDASGPLKLPVYASSDSVVQLAIHQDVITQETIERIGKAVRKRIDDFGYRIGRVIMRPFENNSRYGQLDEKGNPEPQFKRVSADRRDYSVDPDGPTVVDHLFEAGIPTYGVGKAGKMLNDRGFFSYASVKFDNDNQRVASLERLMRDPQQKFVFTNLVETDELYGHRRNPEGYIDHINAMDVTLKRIMKNMHDRSLLIITSDHGNDPTHAGANHTRERTPLLVYHPGIQKPIRLGIRKSYADVAATAGDNFGVLDRMDRGESFLREIV